MNTMFVSGSIFSPGEITTFIALAVVVGLIIIGNVALFFFLRSRRVRKLCTTRLENKRTELLNHLRSISDDGSLDTGVTVDLSDDGDNEDDDNEDDDSESDVTEETLAEGEDITQCEILAVADMSEYTRDKLGYVGDEYDNKRYYVRYKYGFEARLRASDDEVKARYNELVNELALYKGVKISSSFRGQRIYKSRKTLGQIMLRGKTLCVALALDPAEYVDPKYPVIDMSDKKRFEKTPLMYKLSSARRMEYARYLIMQLADRNTLVPFENPEHETVDLSERTIDELFVNHAVKIAVLGEAPELEPEAEPELTVESTVDGATIDMTVYDDDEVAIETPEGRMVFDRSFTARIIQGDDALKHRYSELKNYILAYKGVHSKVSWKRENFTIGRNTIATFSIRGKTLMMYLATDPVKFEDTRYKVENMSEVASRRKTPLLFRVKSDRRTAYAKQLIDIVFSEYGAVRVERKPQDYTSPYRSTDNLVKRGLIKISHNGRGFTQDRNK